jgi:hypothetical protein
MWQSKKPPNPERVEYNAKFVDPFRVRRLGCHIRRALPYAIESIPFGKKNFSDKLSELRT